MSNIGIEARLADGGLWPLIETGKSCKSVVELIVGDDTGAPVTLIQITIQTASGKTICVRIPNSTSDANVTVNDVQL